MGFTPTDYTIETVPILGIDPSEFVNRCQKSQYLTVAFLLGDYGIYCEPIGGETKLQTLDSNWRPNLQPGLVIEEAGKELLIVSFCSNEEFELGFSLPHEIYNYVSVSLEYCDPLVTLREF